MRTSAIECYKSDESSKINAMPVPRKLLDKHTLLPNVVLHFKNLCSISIKLRPGKNKSKLRISVSVNRLVCSLAIYDTIEQLLFPGRVLCGGGATRYLRTSHLLYKQTANMVIHLIKNSEKNSKLYQSNPENATQSSLPKRRRDIDTGQSIYFP